MSAAPACASASLAAGEQLAATAIEATEWLLVEVRSAWGKEGVGDTEMPVTAAAALAAFPGRVVLIRRPDRRGPAVTVVRASVREGGGVAVRRELGSVDEIEPALLEGGEPVRGPILLVCAHGRRDACCARLGVATFDAFAAFVPADRLWQSSHLGGHRFAPNVVVLPFGIQLGRIPNGRVGEVARLLEQGRIPLDLYRGRVLYSRPVQAAEALVRSRSGCDGVADLRLVEHDGDRVVLATPEGECVVRVEERQGPELSISCGTEPEATSIWVARLESSP